MNNKYTLYTDVDDSREATTDAIGRLAEVVTLVLLLDVLHDQGSVNNLHVGLHICVKILVVFGFASWCLFPPNLWFGESISLAVNLSITALGKLLVCWFYCPSWWH